MSEFVVTGSRDFSDCPFIHRMLDRFKISTLFVGDANGVDRFAAAWAMKNEIRLLGFKADWEKHGKAAGPIRNRKMLQDASYKSDGSAVLIAFPGGHGTENCVKQARELGFVVIRIERKT